MIEGGHTFGIDLFFFKPQLIEQLFKYFSLDMEPFAILQVHI